MTTEKPKWEVTCLKIPSQRGGEETYKGILRDNGGKVEFLRYVVDKTEGRDRRPTVFIGVRVDRTKLKRVEGGYAFPEQVPTSDISVYRQGTLEYRKIMRTIALELTGGRFVQAGLEDWTEVAGDLVEERPIGVAGGRT